jgi:hypothetical protein
MRSGMTCAYVVQPSGSDDGVLPWMKSDSSISGSGQLGWPGSPAGPTGRIEISRIGVFVTYATPTGRAFLDRELSLPKACTDDRGRHPRGARLRHEA